MTDHENHQSPFYYTIPSALLEDTPTLKIGYLYAIIVSLCKKEGYCWASNDFLAKKMKVGISSVKNYMNYLIENKWIWRNIDQAKGNERKIFIREPSNEGGQPAGWPRSASPIPEGLASPLAISTKSTSIKKEYKKKRVAATPVNFIQVREKVKLTQNQIETLKSKHSEEAIEWIYDKLNHWKVSKKQETTSDYGAINGWVVNAFKNKANLKVANEDLKDKNIEVATRLIKYLEEISARGNLQILNEEVFDSVLNRRFSLYKENFPVVVSGWYNLEWEQE